MPDNCNPNDCPMIPRIEALEEANIQHGKTHREIFKRLGALETETASQGVLLETINQKLDKLLEWQELNRERLFRVDTLSGLTEKVERLEAKPGKRWDSIVEKVILLAVGGVVALVLARLGLST